MLHIKKIFTIVKILAIFIFLNTANLLPINQILCPFCLDFPSRSFNSVSINWQLDISFALEYS